MPRRLRKFCRVLRINIFLLNPADQAGGPQGTGAVAAQEAEKEQQSAQIQDQRLQAVIGEVPILRWNDQMQDADENQVAYNQAIAVMAAKKTMPVSVPLLSKPCSVTSKLR